MAVTGCYRVALAWRCLVEGTGVLWVCFVGWLVVFVHKPRVCVRVCGGGVLSGFVLLIGGVFVFFQGVGERVRYLLLVYLTGHDQDRSVPVQRVYRLRCH